MYKLDQLQPLYRAQRRNQWGYFKPCDNEVEVWDERTKEWFVGSLYKGKHWEYYNPEEKPLTHCKLWRFIEDERTF